ncbi:MAG: hypothetical protein ABR888_01340 [Thermoplasmata archaeon]|nr:hypothetical protein [Thermoplasmata archaeon]
MSTPTPPSSPAVPSRPTHRTMLYVGVVAAVVIAVLLVVVFVLPGPTSSGSAAAVLTYSGALPVANGAVAGFAGGGWTPVFAVGLVSAVNETEQVNSTNLSNLTSYCPAFLVSGATSLTVAGYSGSRSSGASPAWMFGYRNQSDTLAVVTVLDGHPQVLLTLSGGYCALYAQLITPIPGDVIDSSQAAADAQPDAAAFLATHPNASAEYGLTGGVHFGSFRLGTEWSITYSTCPLSSSASGTGDQLNVTLNATSGHILGTNSSTDVSCGSLTTPTEVVRAPTLGSLSLAARGERSSAPS